MEIEKNLIPIKVKFDHQYVPKYTELIVVSQKTKKQRNKTKTGLHVCICVLHEPIHYRPLGATAFHQTPQRSSLVY